MVAVSHMALGQMEMFLSVKYTLESEDLVQDTLEESY